MLIAHDGRLLRRELLRRVRARMADRAEAGMAADPVRGGVLLGRGMVRVGGGLVAGHGSSNRRPVLPQVRLSLPSYRARYYRHNFGAGGVGGPQFEKLVSALASTCVMSSSPTVCPGGLTAQVRNVCVDYCRALVWVLRYYVGGLHPFSSAASDAAEADDPCAGSVASTSRKSGTSGGGDGGDLLASWRHHYAPLASDLAKYGREALKGAAAVAARRDGPVRPFTQLMAVLPFCRRGRAAMLKGYPRQD
jgi:hypothetical protein